MLWFGPSNQQILDEVRAARAEQRKSQEKLHAKADQILRLLKIVRTRSTRPGTPSGYAIREEAMAIQFGVALPPLSPGSDVKSRELTVSIVGKEPIVSVLEPGIQKHELFPDYVGPQDSEVGLSLVDIDDAGNRSEPSTGSLTLSDTFPPAAPGALGGYTLGEVDDALPVEPDPSEAAPEPSEPSPEV